MMKKQKAPPASPPASIFDRPAITPLPELLRQAAIAHRSNDFARAEALYRAVLAARADHVEALHNFGALCYQQGRREEAAALMGRALQARPNAPDILSNLGAVLLELGHAEESLALADRAAALRPELAEIHHNRGNALFKLGRFPEALEAFERAVALKPNYADAQGNRGVALRKLKRFDEALAALERSATLNLHRPQVHNERGIVLRELGRHAEALASFERAIRLDPGFAEAHNNRAVSLAVLERHDEAMAGYERVLALKPGYAEAVANRANLLIKLNRHDEALAECDRALALAPDAVNVRTLRSSALLEQQRPEEALAESERGLAHAPSSAHAHNIRGLALMRLGRVAEALESFRRALDLDPAVPEHSWNLGTAQLALGDFEHGWRNYEWRWKISGALDKLRDFGKPLWLGDADPTGKTILVHPEQGLGDMIQFSRYASLLAERGAQLVIEVPGALLALFQFNFGKDKVILWGDPLPDFDVHCPFGSLPLAFGTTLDTIPARTPYLQADPRKVEAWKARLPEDGRPRVGIVATGRESHTNDRNRSMPLSALTPLLDCGAQLVLLQKEIRERDRLTQAQHPGILTVAEELGDFSDTAALVAALDLVVSVDTSIAHLAGALGKPVWILLPHAAEWRWLAQREDSPWYPTARLLRQPEPGDWDSVVDRVKADMGERLR